jgi:hypothetical protein
MSYVSVHELLVHLNDFTISDEFAEAVYLVRISAYYEPNRTAPTIAPVNIPVKDTVLRTLSEGILEALQTTRSLHAHQN